MLLRDLIEVTSSEMVIFVNTNEVEYDKDKPNVYFDGKTYMAVKDEFFYPEGIEFESDFDTLEVESIGSDTYEKYSDTVSVIEVYVG